ncbi:MAG: DUF4136 domain-containing protein [gamma proteobacterium symbiont of Taylorina sp.]|nr:DUF4136 domain-containing protein [gamma proteobacterium symbiont of Taylorina sp.]
MFILSKFKFIFFALNITIILSACSSAPSISSLIGGRHEYDYAQNFEQMKQYNFSPISNTLEANPDFNFIRSSGAILAIENSMAAKKITKQRNVLPDFWVNYYYTGSQSMTVGSLNQFFHYNLGLAWDDKYGTGQGIANTSHSFSSGTLIIDIISTNNNQLIWRGSAPIGISAKHSDRKKREALQKAVAVIMYPFPPENDFSSLKHAVPD